MNERARSAALAAIAVGTYRVYEGPCAVDVFAGPRYTSVDTTLTLTGGPSPGRSRAAEISWWDALGGARLRWQSEKGWLVSGLADVGGSGSDFTWEALVSGGYRFKKLVTVLAGYRYLSVDYDDDTVRYDMVLAGPIAGVGFRF